MRCSRCVFFPRDRRRSSAPEDPEGVIPDGLNGLVMCTLRGRTDSTSGEGHSPHARRATVQMGPRFGDPPTTEQPQSPGEGVHVEIELEVGTRARTGPCGPEAGLLQKVASAGARTS